MESKKINEEKNDINKEINYSLYEEKPEKLFDLAQNYFNINKFNKGIEILEKSINLATKKFGGKNEIEMAQFYNKYSDGLIQKIIATKNNNNHFSFQIDEQKINENSSENKNESEKIIEEKETNEEEEENANDINLEEKEQIEEDISIEDEDIAFANLHAANIILKNYLKEYDDKDPKEIGQIIIKYYLQLGDNYILFASFSKLYSDFPKANYYYELSIDIIKKYDDKYSRNLAGLYFEQAQILDFDPKKCLLLLYKSKIIMEYHFQIELNKSNVNIKLIIDEDELDLKTLSYDNKIIYKNKELINNDEIIKAAKENENIEEFVDIIKNLDIKLENVILELKEHDKFMRSKEEKKKDTERQNKINANQNILHNKNTIITNISIMKGKRIEAFNDKDDVKQIEDNDTKEKIYK